MFYSGRLIISQSGALTSKDHIHRKFAKVFKDGDQVVIGILLLEKFRGNESLWYPYISILPSYVSNSAMSGFVSAELHDNKIEKEVNKTITDLQQDFASFDKAVKSFWPKAFSLPTFADYSWARGTLEFFIF